MADDPKRGGSGHTTTMMWVYRPTRPVKEEVPVGCQYGRMGLEFAKHMNQPLDGQPPLGDDDFEITGIMVVIPSPAQMAELINFGDWPEGRIRYATGETLGDPAIPWLEPRKP